MSNKANIAIVGCTGYAGLELVKILYRHKKVKIIELSSENNNGKKLSNLFKEFLNYKLPILKKKNEININNIDIIFIALPHVESQRYISKIINKNVKIIDLSGDFRLSKIKEYNKWYNNKHILKHEIKNFVYGLPELNKNKIIKSNKISNPGCYPTSVLLPLYPIIKNKLINQDNIIIDSKSGYSGAGKKFDLNKLIRNNNLNLYSYNSNFHRHKPEILQELSKINKKSINIFFNPSILPIERGILTNIYCTLKKRISLNDLQLCLKKFYNKNNFIKILPYKKNLSFFDVIGTNNCLIKICNTPSKNIVMIQSCIDNLIKGASGQAVQNMNIMMNFKENEALSLKKIVK